MDCKFKILFAALSLFLFLVGLCQSCDPESLKPGCRIEAGSHCVCGLGCNTTFQYTTMDDCQTALTRSQDPCGHHPCQHGGLCSQIIAQPGYHCFCAGTGHHGRHCETQCPSIEGFRASGTADQYPTQCIVI